MPSTSQNSTLPFLAPHADTVLEAQISPQSPTEQTRILEELGNQNLAFMHQKQRMEITAEELEQFINIKHINEPKSTPSVLSEKEISPSYWATKLLGQYGLKSPTEVITFLKSPAGATTKKLINEQLADLAALKEKENQLYLDKQTRRQRLMAFLLLTTVYKKKAYAKKLREAAREQINDMIERTKAAAAQQCPPGADRATLATAEALLQTHAALSASAGLVESAMQMKLEETDALLNELAELEKEEQAIKERYALFDTHLQNLDEHHAQIEAQLESMPREEVIAGIEKQMDEYHQEIQSLTEEIQDLLDKGNEEEAYKLKDELQALYLKVGGLQDHLSELKGAKVLYDEDGQSVDSFKDAAFILTKEMTKEHKIVKENGQYYLVKHDQNLDSMSTEEKAKAQQAFERVRPEISSVKNVIKDNKGIETTWHKDKHEEVCQRCDKAQVELLDLAKQNYRLQGALAISAENLHRANLKPMPSPQTQVQAPAPKSAPISRTQINFVERPRFPVDQIIKRVFDLMKPTPNPAQVERVKKHFKYDKATQDFINNSIKPGTPIPPETMRLLLASMARFELDAYKPNNMNKASPLEQTLQKEPTPLTAPTPLSIKPKGL